MSTHNLIFHSRPKAEADWTCPRSRYYAYDFEGGIVKDNLTLELFIGTCLHDALAAIASQHTTGTVNIIDIATKTGKLVLDTLLEYAGDVPDTSPDILQAREQACLVEGLVYGFYKSVWPSLIKEYPDIVAFEKECIYPHDLTGNINKQGPFIFRAKPDLLLRGEAGLLYLELKSTSSKKVEWIESWKTAIQVHATAKAIEFTLGEPILGTIVQGMYKGFSSYGKFSSQLVYGYEKKGNPPFSKTIISTEYKPGFRKSPVWEMEGGATGWVDKLSQETMADQFPQTPLMFTNEDMATTFFRQRAIRESDIHPDSPFTPFSMDKLFPQSFKACKPAWGHACSYYNLCHTTAGQDPLNRGFILKDHEHEIAFEELIPGLLS